MKGVLFFLRLFFVITIAGLTKVEYIYNINLGIDELFLKDDSGALLTIYPGRMPIGNSICFFLLSLAFSCVFVLIASYDREIGLSRLTRVNQQPMIDLYQRLEGRME